MNDIKKLFGIDSLCYFCESNENYDDLYLEILDQIETIKGTFEKKELEYENNDIHIAINEIPLNFLGRAEGYHWFKDINSFFKIGFKDKYKNKGLNDIRVQLQGIGIYTIGIKSLINFINNMLLRHYVSGYYPITRADLNCFIQYDFSFVTKEMFVTRKRKYATISEIGNAISTQTIYVGKEPFKLRLYNKKEELKKSNKKDLMYEYFMNNGFNMEDEVFNVEFELHRTHLRQYNILTVEDLLSNAQNLFKASMDDIRLIDINSISEENLKSHNKNRADIHPVWKDIKDSYVLDDFLQIELPLQRVKRKISIYDDYKFKIEFIALLRRAFINQLNIDSELIEILVQEAKESLHKHKNDVSFKNRFTDVDIIHEDGKVEKLRLLEDGQLIKPLDTLTVSKLQDYDLHVYLDKVKEVQHLSDRNRDIYEVALKEAIKRNLIPCINSSEARS